MEFRDWLQAFMTQHSLTKEDVSGLGGVSVQSVYAWFRGEGPLHPEHVKVQLQVALERGGGAAGLGAERLGMAGESRTPQRDKTAWSAFGLVHALRGGQELPQDLVDDTRLHDGMDNLVDILRGPDRQAAEWLLGNLKVFGDRARDQMPPRKKKKGGGRPRSGD